MNVTFYIPFYNYNDDAFSMDDGYYNDNEYTKALVSEYEKTKDTVYKAMSDPTAHNTYIDSRTYKFGKKIPKKEKKLSYSECKGKLLDMDGNEETVDNIISHFAQEEMFINHLILNFDTSEEEFETEIKMWNKAHNEINEYISKGEDWVLQHEPKRNIRICFKNNSNEDIYAELVNCKIIEQSKINEYIILIEKIILIDKFI